MRLGMFSGIAILIASAGMAIAQSGMPPPSAGGASKTAPTTPGAPAAALQDAVGLLKSRLDELDKKVLTLQRELAEARSRADAAKGEVTLMGNALTALQKKYLAHKHDYSYTEVNWGNVRVVSSGRPVIEQEKYVYVGSVKGNTSSKSKTSPPID